VIDRIDITLCGSAIFVVQSISNNS